MDRHERNQAMTARIEQVDFQLRILKMAVVDASSELWQAKALWTAIDNIRRGLTDPLKPISEEHPTNQPSLRESWGILSAWDDESDEQQLANRKDMLKQRFKGRRTPNDKAMES